MFTKIFGKKKLKQDKLANIFINATLSAIEEGFDDVVGLINDSPEFETPPNISIENDSKFILIILAANLKEIPRHFEAHVDNQLIITIIDKLALVFDTEADKLEEVLKDYQSYLSRVNHPSRNTLYAMSKAMFYKYELGQYQEAYFRDMNAPNPLFLKRLDEAMSLFMYNWDAIKEEYQVIAR